MVPAGVGDTLLPDGLLAPGRGVDTTPPETTIDSGADRGDDRLHADVRLLLQRGRLDVRVQRRRRRVRRLRLAAHDRRTRRRGAHLPRPGDRRRRERGRTPAQRAFTVDTGPPDTRSTPARASRPRQDANVLFLHRRRPAHGSSAASTAAPSAPAAPPSRPATSGRQAHPRRAGGRLRREPGPDSERVRVPDPGGHGWGIAPPKPGVTINVQEVSGTVLIGIPSLRGRSARSGRASQKGITFVPLTAAEQIPVGSFLDTRRGTVRLQSATNAAGDSPDRRLPVLDLPGAPVEAAQRQGAHRPRPEGRQLQPLRRRARQARQRLASRRAVRRLRANARGRFRTSGRNSSATVRGTRWETIDRCDGTLTKVQRGTVVVRDFQKKKNVVAQSGQELPRPRPPLEASPRRSASACRAPRRCSLGHTRSGRSGAW